MPMTVMMSTDRKSSYKLPPTTIRDKLISQEARRNKALEEQKRKRAQKIDSARQLDLFADLTLGASDDEEPAIAVGVAQEDGVEDGDQDARLAPGSIAQYAAMLAEGHQSIPSSAPPISPPQRPFFTIQAQSIPRADVQPDAEQPEVGLSKSRTSKKKKAGKQKRRTNKPSKWADKCMYAELLEMSADELWDQSFGVEGKDADEFADGLPKGLETAWVAVAPVPAGKRCLAVTHTSAGVSGLVPNTTLRSRLLGKTLLARFPSILPPLTVLDCILDKRWRENGILHVLDVIRWKGQDVGDCEAGFRFWWRDTRLAELGQPTKAEYQTLHPPSSDTSSASSLHQSNAPAAPPNKSTFSYPISFIPVPYHSSTTLAALDTEIIPAAKSWRWFNVPLPTHLRLNTVGEASSTGQAPMESGMDIEVASQPAPAFAPISPPPTPYPYPRSVQSTSSSTIPAFVEPDGLLLYVSEASYEPGTSPLSSWIPIHSYDSAPADEEGDSPGKLATSKASQRPLDLFQRLVKRRLQRRGDVSEVDMNDDAGVGDNIHMDADMDMDT